MATTTDNKVAQVEEWIATRTAEGKWFETTYYFDSADDNDSWWHKFAATKSPVVPDVCWSTREFNPKDVTSIDDVTDKKLELTATVKDEEDIWEGVEVAIRAVKPTTDSWGNQLDWRVLGDNILSHHESPNGVLYLENIWTDRECFGSEEIGKIFEEFDDDEELDDSVFHHVDIRTIHAQRYWDKNTADGNFLIRVISSDLDEDQLVALCKENGL